MNKFSSLSTSVLLALLTSSFMVAAYADGESPSRSSPRESNNSINGTATTDNVVNTEKDKKYKFHAISAAAPAVNTNAGSLSQEVAPILYDQQGMPIISINDPQLPLRTPPNYHATATAKLAPKAAPTAAAATATASLASASDPTLALAAAQLSALKAASAESDIADAPLAMALSLTETAATPATTNLTNLASTGTSLTPNNLLEEEEEEEVNNIVTTPEQFPSIVDMTRTEHSIDLKNEYTEAVESTDSAAPDSSDAMSATSADEPHLLKIAFEHPSTFANSFIVAGDTTIIAYNNDQGNFAISFKLRPLSLLEIQTLDFARFKKHLTARFSDKQNMLYGEYDILHDYANVKDALAAHALSELKLNEPSAMALNPSDPYMDLSFKAFLKKGHDGILPDQHSFFYERNILNQGYLATLTCELRGSQAQANLTQQYFEAFSPLCERILDSYSFAFVK